MKTEDEVMQERANFEYDLDENRQSFMVGWQHCLMYSPTVRALQQKLEVAKKALENIEKYTFRSAGPAGCDSHGVTHPCGKCAGLYDEKWIARQALEEIEK